MKKRKHDFKLLSNEQCDCGRKIKLNVAERIKRRPLDCYPCHVGTKDRGNRG